MEKIYATQEWVKDCGDLLHSVNPVGTGSFSMNRKADSDIGEYSSTLGLNTIATYKAQHVTGMYNVADKAYELYYVNWLNAPSPRPICCISEEYHFDPITRIIELVNPTYMVEYDDIPTGYYFFEYSGTEPTFSVGQVFMKIYNGGYKIFRTRITNNAATIGKYAHMIGNGTSDTERSNAHTLDWEGNAWYSGDIYVGSTSGTNRDEGSKKLATEEYVNANASQVQFITWEADD